MYALPLLTVLRLCRRFVVADMQVHGISASNLLENIDVYMNYIEDEQSNHGRTGSPSTASDNS